MPKISIIIPIYNVEKYLKCCLDSVLDQTFKDFEVILVNDGSTDSCRQICEIYKNKDKRVKVINKENGGLSSARNSGINIARGKYITFIDSDDFIEKDMCKILYELSEFYKADISVCKSIDVSETGKIINYIKLDEKIKCFSNVKALEEIHKDIRVCTWAKLYNRKLFNSLKFPEGKIHEDEFTTHILLYNSNKVVSINKAMYYYRKVNTSITNSKFNLNRLHIIEAIESRIQFMNEIGDLNLYLKTLIEYGNKLIEIYYKIKENLEQPEKYLVEIKFKFDKVFKKIILNKNVSVKNKIKFLVFKISPQLLKIILVKKY